MAFANPVLRCRRLHNRGRAELQSSAIPCLGEQAVIAGRVGMTGIEDCDLAVEADRRTGDQRFAKFVADAVDGVTRDEVVRAVEHYIDIGDFILQAFVVEAFVERYDVTFRVDFGEAYAPGFGLRLPQ